MSEIGLKIDERIWRNCQLNRRGMVDNVGRVETGDVESFVGGTHAEYPWDYYEKY